MSKTSDFNETLWSAVTEPNRRRLLDLLLAEGDLSASALAREVTFTRQAVSKHMSVLKSAGLVKTKQRGKEVQFAIEPKRFRMAAEELSKAAFVWNERLLHIKHIAEALQHSTKK
jgi:DNA-binding transcriptional ArsR family regulator